MAGMDFWKVAIPTSLSALSLVWNLANSYRTTRISREASAATVTLDEFKSRLRQPVLDCLKDVAAEIRELESLYLRRELSADKDKLISLNRGIALKLSDLNFVLNHCDTSGNCSGTMYHRAGEVYQDCIANYLNAGMNEAHQENDRIAALRNIPKEHKNISEYINKAFENEVRVLSPTPVGFLDFIFGRRKPTINACTMVPYKPVGK